MMSLAAQSKDRWGESNALDVFGVAIILDPALFDLIDHPPLMAFWARSL